MILRISGYVVASVTAIACATLVSVEPIDRYLSDQNILQTSSGAVRLGKVNKELLMTEFSVRNAEDGSLLLSGTTKTPEIYEFALGKFKKQIESINKDGGVKAESGKKEKLDYRTAAWTYDTILKTRTYILYEAERTPSFELILDESETPIQKSTGIYKNLNELINYQTTMMRQFSNTKHFLSTEK